jgi:hypothetical protein
MRFNGLKQAASRFWRAYIAAEDPDANGEVVRQQRIDDFTLFADLLEDMRRWERERGTALGDLRNA